MPVAGAAGSAAHFYASASMNPSKVSSLDPSMLGPVDAAAGRAAGYPGDYAMNPALMKPMGRAVNAPVEFEVEPFEAMRSRNAAVFRGHRRS